MLTKSKEVSWDWGGGVDEKGMRGAGIGKRVLGWGAGLVDVGKAILRQERDASRMSRDESRGGPTLGQSRFWEGDNR